VLALIAARLLVAKAVGVGLGNVGSGASWRQALWVGCAMTPMSSMALLIASQFVVASPSTGYQIASVALPAILLMEVLGAVIATVAIYRAGESSKPWAPLRAVDRTGDRMSLEAFPPFRAADAGRGAGVAAGQHHDYDLAPYAEDMLRLMRKPRCPAAWCPR
jgi:hypothetical protein